MSLWQFSAMVSAYIEINKAKDGPRVPSDAEIAGIQDFMLNL